MLGNGLEGKGTLVLLSKALTIFIQEYVWAHGFAVATAKNYQWAINSLIKAIGDKDLLELTIQDLRTWQQWMVSRNYEINAINSFLYRIRLIIRYFAKRYVLKIDPSEIIIPKKVQHIPKYLSVEDIKKLYDKGDLRGKALVAVLYSSGIRVGELVKLRKKDIYGDVLKIRGKGNKERLAFLDKDTLNILSNYLRSRRDSSQFLFYSHKGSGLGTARVERIIRDLGIEARLDQTVTPHILRHSYATHMAKAGIGPYHLQKLLGHAHVSTTQIYVHLDENDSRMAYSKFHTPLNLQ